MATPPFPFRYDAHDWQADEVVTADLLNNYGHRILTEKTTADVTGVGATPVTLLAGSATVKANREIKISVGGTFTGTLADLVKVKIYIGATLIGNVWEYAVSATTLLKPCYFWETAFVSADLHTFSVTIEQIGGGAALTAWDGWTLLVEDVGSSNVIVY